MSDADRIKELRMMSEMTQRGFSSFLGIPTGTLRNWEQGISAPPEYVYNMIEKVIRRDKMLNVETIKFMKMLDDLAKMSNVGIEGFSTATAELYQTVVYYDDLHDDDRKNRIVLDAVIDECHHDIVCYYEDTEDYTIRAVEDDGVFIVVDFLKTDDQIVIEHGRWYFASITHD